MNSFDNIKSIALPDKVGFTLYASKEDFKLFSSLIYTLLSSREQYEISKFHDDWLWSHHFCISQYMRTSFVEKKPTRVLNEGTKAKTIYAVDYDFITAFVMVRLFRSQLSKSYFPYWLHEGVDLFEEAFKSSLVSEALLDDDEYLDVVKFGFSTDTMTPPGTLAKINHFFRITDRQRINQTKEIFRSFNPWWDEQFFNDKRKNKKSLNPKCFNISYNDYCLVQEKIDLYAETFFETPSLFFAGYFPTDWSSFDKEELLKDFKGEAGGGVFDSF